MIEQEQAKQLVLLLAEQFAEHQSAPWLTDRIQQVVQDPGVSDTLREAANEIPEAERGVLAPEVRQFLETLTEKPSPRHSATRRKVASEDMAARGAGC